jgi:hypothetical protein
MTPKRWDTFIRSSKAVGARVRVAMSDEDRASYPLPEEMVLALQELAPGSRVIQFDPSIANGVVGTVVESSTSGWLKVEIPDFGVADIPGRALEDAGAVQTMAPATRTSRMD